MAVQVGSLFASLTLDSSGYTRGFAQAERATSSAMGRIQRQAGLTTRAVEGVNRSFSQPIRPYSLIAVSRAFDNTADRANLLRGSLIATTAVFGGFAAALTSNVILRYADTYTLLNNQLRVVSESSADLRAQLEAVDAVATRSRSGLKETAVLYSRLRKAAPNLDSEKALRYTETIQKALQLGGASAQEAASAAIQFSQAIASNRLGGEELRAILETPLGLSLAKGLGVSIGKFRELSIQGKLTADVILGALDKIGASVDEQFAGSVQTLDQAIQYADNQFIKYIGSVNDAYGVTGLLGSAVISFADNLETVGNVLQYVVPLVSGLFAAKFLGRLGGGFSNSFGSAIKDMQRVERAADRATAGISGAWRELRQRTAADVGAARAEVNSFTQKIAEAQKAQAALAAAKTTGPRGQFAETSIVKSVKRDYAELQRLDNQRLENTQKIADAQRRLSTATAQVTPRILAATQQVVAAEAKVNEILQKQEQLRAAQRANVMRQVQAGVGVLQRPGPTKAALDEAKAAAREQIKLQRELAAAQEQAGRAREALSQRYIGLTTAEAAAQRAAANERIAQLNQINTLSSKQADILVKRGELQTRLMRNEAAMDRSSMANFARQAREAATQVGAYQFALGMAQMRQEAAAKSAQFLGRALTFAGAAMGSLYSFLGGPWGVALTAATVGFTVWAARSAQASKNAADAQEIISSRLEKAGKSSERAAEAFERLAQRTKLEEITKEFKKVEQEFDKIATDIENRARNFDDQLFEKGTNINDPFQKIVKAGLRDLKLGITDVDTLIKRVRSAGQINLIDPLDIAELVAFFEQLREGSETLKLINQDANRAKASLGQFASTFSMMANAMENEKRLERAVDNLSYEKLLSQIGDDERKIADEMIAALQANGDKLSEPLKKYIQNQAKLLTSLDKIRAAADRPAAERPKAANQNIRRVSDISTGGADPFQTAKVADQLSKLNALKKEINEVGTTYAAAKEVIRRGTPLLNEKAFGSEADAQKVKAVIEAVKLEAQKLSEGVSSGKVEAVEATNRLEAMKQTLVSSGVEDNVATAIVEDISKAIEAISSLKAEYIALVAQIKEAEAAGNIQTFPGGSVLKRVPKPGGGVNVRTLESFLPGQAALTEEQAAQAQVDKLKGELDTIIQKVQSLPKDALFKAMFGDNPEALPGAIAQAQARIGEVVQKIIDGRIPADDLGIAINWIKQGLIDAGAESDAMDPFLATLRATLGRMDPMIAKINAMTNAMRQLAAAAASVKMPTGGSGGGSGGGSSPPLGTERFATGGAFRVGGAGGTDSQLVQFMASPNETVAVFTPSQMRAFNGALGGSSGGGMVVQAPVTIMASDANSFRNSRRQVQMDIADAVTAAVNRTR